MAQADSACEAVCFLAGAQTVGIAWRLLMLFLCAGPGNIGFGGGPVHAPAGLWGKLQRARKGPAQRDPLNAGMPEDPGLHVIPSRIQLRFFLLPSVEGSILMLWAPAEHAQRDVNSHRLLGYKLWDPSLGGGSWLQTGAA